MKEKLNMLSLAENEMKSISGGDDAGGMECNGTWWSCTTNDDWHANVIAGIRTTKLLSTNGHFSKYSYLFYDNK